MRCVEVLKQVQEEIAHTALEAGRDPSKIQLVVVSKNQSIETIRALFDCGIRHFGESRIQEAEEKQRLLPQEIQWHLIGSLQSKKVPKAVGAYQLIHSIDSLDLLTKISKKSIEKNLLTDVLLEVNTSGEPNKHGFSPELACEQFPLLLALPGVRIRGLMTMAAQMLAGSEEEQKRVRASFRLLAEIKQEIEKDFPTCLPNFSELSMGMSQDFKIAIEEGATLLRIGSRLFFT
jgi:pyridoxal phosphate enzyme (YggS family)